MVSIVALASAIVNLRASSSATGLSRRAMIRCSCRRRFSVACFARSTRATGKEWPSGLGLFSSAIWFSSAPSLA